MSRIIIRLIITALAWLWAAPIRAISWFVRWLVPTLSNDCPTVGLFGQPALLPAGPPDCSIAAALAHKQRHEAGLARLGTVRHR